MRKIYKENDLPLYEFVVNPDDESGVQLISLVSEPAIGIKGLCFKKSETIECEFKALKDKQIIAGPVLIPDLKIKRIDDAGNKYMGYFKPETVEMLYNKFQSEGGNRRINIEHSNQMVNGYLLDTFIIRDKYYNGAKAYGFNDLPVGTWFATVKIEDKDFWKSEVKENERFGFSVEGLFSEKPANFSSDENKTIQEWIDILTEDDWVIIDDRFKQFLKTNINNLK